MSVEARKILEGPSVLAPRVDLGRCRICGGATRTLLDLGHMPPANALKSTREEPEAAFPLVLQHCSCGSFQLRDCLDARDLYSSYFYSTPKSAMLQAHYARLTDYLRRRGYLSTDDFILEVGSNTGEFLAFLRSRVGRVLGVDPASNICEVARERGIATVNDFFDRRVAHAIVAEHGRPDVVVARHCLAHNADPHVIVGAVSEILADDGTLIIENAYALNMIESNEFDQIYHEHMFYFTVHALDVLLARHGFVIVDVMTSPVHGGSIACIAERKRPGTTRGRTVVAALRREEALLTEERVDRFVLESQRNILDLHAAVAKLRGEGKRIFAYGATAKGATLVNAAGLTYHDIPICADSTAQKQGKFVPRAGIAIVPEAEAYAARPDYFLLTAWNYKDELIAKVRAAGLADTRFIVPVPRVSLV